MAILHRIIFISILLFIAVLCAGILIGILICERIDKNDV